MHNLIWEGNRFLVFRQAGQAVLERRRIKHRGKHIQVRGHGFNLLANAHIVSAPGGVAEHVHGQLDLVRGQGFPGFGQKTGNGSRTIFFGVFVGKGGALDAPIGRETDVIKLNFVEALLGGFHSQGNVVIPHFFPHRVRPTQVFPVAPDAIGLSVDDGPFRVGGGQRFVLEDHDPGNGVDVPVVEPLHPGRPVFDHRAAAGSNVHRQLDAAGIGNIPTISLDIHHDSVQFGAFQQVLDMGPMGRRAQPIIGDVETLGIAGGSDFGGERECEGQVGGHRPMSQSITGFICPLCPCQLAVFQVAQQLIVFWRRGRERLIGQNREGREHQT